MKENIKKIKLPEKLVDLSDAAKGKVKIIELPDKKFIDQDDFVEIIGFGKVHKNFFPLTTINYNGKIKFVK